MCFNLFCLYKLTVWLKRFTLEISETMMFSRSRCIICQKSTSEELRCPLRASGDRADPKAVYTSFLCNVFEFNALEALPIALSMPLDRDVEVLIENDASWHKSCRLQFSTSKLNKAKERLARKREQAQKENRKCELLKHEGCLLTIKKTVFCVVRVANFTKSPHSPLLRSSAWW